MGIYAWYGAAIVAAVIFDRVRWLGIGLLCFSFYFIAFRFETGFDWPIYKALYNIGAVSGALDFAAYGKLYNGEPLFLIVQSFLAKAFPSYESLQFIFSSIFLASLFYFGLNFSRDRVFEFFAIAMSYLVFTVGFSTVRQSLAIAFFLIALIFYARRFFAFAAAASIVSFLFHYSASLYIVASVIAFASIRIDRTKGVATFLGVLVAILFCYAAIFLAWKVGVLPGGERADYYAASLRKYRFGLWDGMFAVLFLGMAAHVIVSEVFFSNALDCDRRTEMVSRLIVVLAAVSIASLIMPVVRDRLSYLLWIMYAVFVTRNGVFLRKAAAIAVVAFGILFNVIAHFRYPNDLMFIPYQNSLTGSFAEGKSSGERYNEFIIEHNKLISQ